MIKPFLRYVGGKTRYAPQIIGEFPEDMKEYREPMVGGGGMAIYLSQVWGSRLRMKLGDADPEIADIWESVLYENEELLSILVDKISEFPKGETRVDSAVRGILMNRMREFGNYGSVVKSFVDIQDELEQLRLRISNVGSLLGVTEFRHEDYKWALREENPECVVFLDPPYMEVGDGNGYYMGHKQFDYDELLRELEITKNRFIMTIDRAFVEMIGIHKFTVKRLDVFPTMGGKKRTEYLIKNF